MKKLLLLLFVSAAINAQTLLQENFDALGSPITLPTGWTMTNQSASASTIVWFNGGTTMAPYSGAGYIASNYQAVTTGVGTISTWLMTPSILVQNGDEVSFYSRTVDSPAYADRMEFRMSTLGAASVTPSTGSTGVGSYSTVCLTINPTLTLTGYPNTWTKYTYVVSGLTGATSCKFAFRYFVTSGGPSGANSDYIGVDSFVAKRPVANDLSLNSVTVPAYLAAGNYNFMGQVINEGTNAVTSYQVTWQSNGGAINTYNVTGVNIAVGATHNFTHNLPLNAVVGQTYALNFNVSTVNGGADGDVTNNTLSTSTQVPSGSTTYKPMIEKFTGSTCAPCAAYNGSTFNAFYTAENQNFNYVAYQMNWPGTGDPYYTAEGGVRRGYYGVNAITSLWIDGSEYSTNNNQAALTAYVNAQTAKTGYFELTATRDFTGNTALVNYNITPYLSGNYVLQAAVIEKTTTGNVATNGETSFKHVMMKMVPNATGTPITVTAGTPITGSISASLAGTFIEEIADCEVVLFLQNPTTKEIMQSYTATNVLSAKQNTLKSVTLYPNPAQDFIRLSNIDVVDIQVTDLMGKTVLSLTNVNDQTNVNVSNLNTGVYFFTVKNDSVNETIKFVKK